MKDYAIIIPASLGYMTGANAILNALEVYKFDIDIYMIYGFDFGNLLSEEYQKQFPQVNFVPAQFNFWKGLYQYEQLGTRTQEQGWIMLWYPLYFGLQLFEQYNYKSISFWGADCCIVCNWMEYFDVAYYLNRIVLASSDFTTGIGFLHDWPYEWPYPHTWNVPYSDSPFIVPKTHKTVIELMLQYAERPKCQIDIMDGLNYAIFDVGAPVFEVPGNLWIHNVAQSDLIMRNDLFTIDDPPRLYSLLARVKSFHSRHWSISHTYSFVSKFDSPWAKTNYILYNHVWYFFAKQCRVQWNYPIEQEKQWSPENVDAVLWTPDVEQKLFGGPVSISPNRIY